MSRRKNSNGVSVHQRLKAIENAIGIGNGDLPAGIDVGEKFVGPNDRDFWKHSSELNSFSSRGSLRDPYADHGWVYACASAIAWNIAQVPFAIMEEATEEPEVRSSEGPMPRPQIVKRHIQRSLQRRIQDPEGEARELHRGPWVDLFAKPNPLMVTSQFMEAVFVTLLTRGPVYILREGAGEFIEPDEVPLELWPFGPDGWEIVQDEATKLPVGYRFTPPGASAHEEATIELPLRSVVRLNRWSPLNQLGGLAPLEPALADVRQDLKASSWNEAFFDQGADPGGVLTTPKDMSPEKATQIRTQWEGRHLGHRRRHRIAVLYNGIQYQAVTPTHTEMGFLQQRTWNKEVIQAVFKVPDSELSVFNQLTYSNAVSADRAFWAKTLIPWMTYLETAFCHDLFFGRVFGQYNLSQVEALATLIQDVVIAAQGLQALGYPLNVINKRLNLRMDEVSWGDDAYTTLGTVPYTALHETLEEQFGDISPEEEPAPPADPGAEPTEPAEPEGPKEPARGAPHIRGSFVKEGRVGGPKWEAIIRVAQQPGERRIQKTVREWFFDALKEQIRRIRVAANNGDLEQSSRGLRRFLRGRNWKGLDESIRRKTQVELSEAFLDFIVFNREEWDEQMSKRMRPEYDRLAVLSLETAINDIGGVFTFDLGDPRVLEFLQNKTSDVQGVSTRVHTNIREELLEGLSRGESSAQLQERMRRAFNFQATPARTLRVARTESAQTVNGTRDLIFQEEGIEKQEWLTSGDEVVRPDHVILGRTSARPLGHNYMTDLGKPGTLLFPADPQGPANQVINCRCAALPKV